MKTQRFLSLSVLLGLVVFGSLTLSSCTTPSKSVSLIQTKLEPYECGSVKRIQTIDGIFLASQPQAEDFKHASEGGIKTVVNLRKPNELRWDEEKVVTDLGMEYHNIPFKAFDELTDEVFNKTRALFNDSTKRPLLVHCASANRVGAVWLAHRVLDAKLSFEEAEAEAKVVGMKLPAYTRRAKIYIDKYKDK